MKVIKTKKYIIFSIAIILLIVCVGICCYKKREKVKKEEAIAEQQAIENAGIEASIKEKAIGNAKAKGYEIQDVDEKMISINNDGVKYYFYIDASGVCFDECEFEVQEEGVKVKEGAILISIRQKDNNNLSVRYDDTRIILLDDGTEEAMYSGMSFISNTDFDKESFVINSFVPDAEQKALEAYDTIMEYTSVDKLKKQYNHALAICDQLNN